jgi:UPF0176 protein
MTEPAFGIATFYRFQELPDPASIRPLLLQDLKSLKVRGSVLLAQEGLNGTISATAESMTAALNAIRNRCGVPHLECKFAKHTQRPFLRLKVKVKKEIVTIGPVACDPQARVGTYVEPRDWNALITEPDVLVIDTRNSYEFGIGTFHGSIDPGTDKFSDFPKWVRSQLANAKHKKIAMFCTGGIRCEKATSFMLSEGFEQVYHLRGGILRYLEEVPPSQSLWQGACFVFDERVAVGHGQQPADVSMCHGCHKPVTAEDRSSPLFEEGVSCPACADKLTDVQKASNRERQKQYELAAKRGVTHLGPKET